ncbi:MAG: response regulator transcription factor [Anaerolineales bacterium]|nr:response regulator transcription factor [Anaerolineales bacterium]
MKPIRILVVDNQSVVRDGMVAILSFQKNIKVVGEGQDGLEAIELAKQTKPDIVLLDVQMPRLNGLEAIPRIKEVSPKSNILVLTGFSESDQAYQAIKAGALGFLLKDATRAQLIQAIQDVAAGQASIQPAIAMKVINEIDHPAELMYTADPLTPRELETLKLIARGLSNQEISAELIVHERTVAKYVSSILEKLHLANRTQAALYAIREGLAEPKK